MEFTAEGLELRIWFLGLGIGAYRVQQPRGFKNQGLYIAQSLYYNHWKPLPTSKNLTEIVRGSSGKKKLRSSFGLSDCL